ncbi:MAG: LUD domain-containing protein [Pseudomonadota bacterium]
MSSGREQVLGALRRALKRGGSDAVEVTEVDGRLSDHPRNLVPQRAQLPAAERLDLFEAQATSQAASLTRVAGPNQVPEAIADYLKSQNLPADLRLSPDPALEGLPWERAPLLSHTSGPARESDTVSVTRAIAGIAETGTLMLQSGAEGATTLNFLPETNVVVLSAEAVVSSYEDAWDLIRRQHGAGTMPRTVNFITGPSRTADIEQTIQLGAHGPRRLHIILVESGS